MDEPWAARYPRNMNASGDGVPRSKPSFAAFMPIFVFCLALLLVWGVPGLVNGDWKGGTWQAPPDVGLQPPLDPATGSVLSLDSAVELGHPCSRSGPPVVRRPWNPSLGEIRQLEADLPRLLKSIGDTLSLAGGLRLPPLRDYYRQYAGLELVTGERIIYVSAFHPGELNLWAGMGIDTARWRRRSITACDGWRAFWGVEYDPASRRFRGFSFNGQA